MAQLGRWKSHRRQRDRMASCSAYNSAVRPNLKACPVAALRILGFRQPFRLQEFGTILRPNAWRICRKLPEQRTAAPDHSTRY